MRAVIQRVNKASVTVEHREVAAIGRGLVIFLGIEKGDSLAEAVYIANKIAQLRIFADQQGKMNLDVQESQSELLVVSQFTLCANLNDSGRRPGFDRAETPQKAEQLYQEFIRVLKSLRLEVKQGVFREYMTVRIENDGPVTFVLDKRGEDKTQG
ncbi:MAG: D-aminoacyl-tRNA deacylase [Candidatus Omnitrophota bacterium]